MHARGHSRLHFLAAAIRFPYSALQSMPQAPDQLLLQLLAIFVSAKVLGELFERIKLPSVLGEILAGAALGPYATG